MQAFAPLRPFVTSSTAVRSRSNGPVVLSSRPCLLPPHCSPVRPPPVAAPPYICRLAHSTLRDVPVPMAYPGSSSTPGSLTELHDAPDFDALVDPDGYLSVEVSSLSVEPCEGEFLIVTVFEIKREEVSSILRLIFDLPMRKC
ncbi:hypothetical protein B296_00030277 [Ensete ventricosum]|uniref:Uncharacterized protein n=1 Tax=Ensete ventricosum TaxID=4639 RepID=A0A426X830_ENSVE|nr:hypothetical protein B296_00030277 [Ensete ventricosum]